MLRSRKAHEWWFNNGSTGKLSSYITVRRDSAVKAIPVTLSSRVYHRRNWLVRALSSPYIANP